VIKTPLQHEKIRKRTYPEFSPTVSGLEEGKSNKKKKNRGTTKSQEPNRTKCFKITNK